MDIEQVSALPKAKCNICPLSEAAQSANDPTRRIACAASKDSKPMRQGKIYVITHPDNQIPMTRRTSTGLWGIMGLPSSGWDKSEQDQTVALTADVRKIRLPQKFSHVFTHFRLKWKLSMFRSARLAAACELQLGRYQPRRLPTLFKSLATGSIIYGIYVSS